MTFTVDHSASNAKKPAGRYEVIVEQVKPSFTRKNNPCLNFVLVIRNDVDKQVNIIVSDAEAEAAKLEAEGEAEYMRLLAEAYDTQDKKDFYEFTLALDALKSSLDGSEKTVILDANSELAQILMGAG